MKANLLITIIAALVLSGCGLFLSGPSAAIKQMMADSEKGDIDAMVKAWSKKAIEEQGVDSVRRKERRRRFASRNRLAIQRLVLLVGWRK